MRTKLFPAIKYVFFLLAGIVIIYYLFKRYYTPTFVDNFKSVKLYWVFIAVFCATISNIFRALRWELMVRPFAYEKKPFLPFFNALMLGYLVNLALPRAGELARCAYLSKKEKVNTINLIGTVIAERFIDLLALLFIVILALLLYADLIVQFLSVVNIDDYLEQKKLIVFIGVISVVLIFIALFFLLKRGNPAITKVNHLLTRLKEGLLSIKKIDHPSLFIFFTIGIWFFYIVSTYFGFLMLKETSTLIFSDAILTVVAGSFGMIAPIQGGIGAYHFMVSECLILLNINASVALVFATVLHASQTMAVIFFGLIALKPKSINS